MLGKKYILFVMFVYESIGRDHEFCVGNCACISAAHTKVWTSGKGLNVLKVWGKVGADRGHRPDEIITQKGKEEERKERK